MPLYEYQCNDCHSTSEILVKSSAEQAMCPRCGGRRLTKLFSTFATTASSDTSCGMDRVECPSGACCAGGACAHK